MRSSSGFFACRPLRLLVGGQAVLADHVDALLDQVRVQALHLLLRHLDLLERRGDLLEGEIALVLALRDERPKLLRLPQKLYRAVRRGVPRPLGMLLLAPVGQQNVSLLSHFPAILLG